MQNDILERLFEDESLVGVLFHNKNPEYIKKALKAIFESYYGPKILVDKGRAYGGDEGRTIWGHESRQ